LFQATNPDKISPVRIRSITFFVNPAYPLEDSKLELAGDFLHATRPAFIDAGFEVQSARLATVPFPHLLAGQEHELVHLAQRLEKAAVEQGYDYVSLGPALPEQLETYPMIPDALAGADRVFLSGLMTTPRGEVSLPAVRQCAEVIRNSSGISADGFTNLRFAALANVPAGSPFFPAAYHNNIEPTFALATESADLAVEAFTQAESLNEARTNLIDAMEKSGSQLAKVALEVEKKSGIKFAGIDYSLAPFPTEERSLGTALERMGVPELGASGSLAAAAILADTMDQASIMRTGFSGLFLPVLEDATLARRAAEGSLGVMDLLLFSAVCGTGLDTVPLPGDISTDQLSAILLDLASLSLRLAKPLTARLMPIPGKKAGDPTGFDFPYFANSRVMPIHALPLVGVLKSNESFSLQRKPVP